jgi:transcriptional regulator with XRE-family HTH domain
MDDQQRRIELARFLRTRREGFSPLQAGVPLAGRRRTPGLRREELATLAGVSSSWYTWLEQGRAITVSAQVLESLANALQLNGVERTHLFILARGEVPATPPPSTDVVGETLQQMLDALGTFPAYIVNARWDVVAWNKAACHVFVDFAALSRNECNLLRLLFTHPTLRQRYEDWEGVARRIIALFRASATQAVGEAWFIALVEELRRSSPEFQAWWPRHDIAEAPHDGKALNHPQVGRLILQPNPLQVGLAPDLWMLVYTPAPGTDTAARLQRLSSPAVEQAGERGMQPKDGIRQGELQRQQGEDDDEMQRLIDPDGFDDAVACFQGIDDKVGDEDNGYGNGRRAGK